MSKPAILICDDEEGLRESFKLILAKQYDLTFAENGLEALQLLKSLSFDLMILDIKMPKIHGFDVLKDARLAKPLLPVIIVTGYQSIEIAQEALKLGACDYLPKPFTPTQLLKVVLAHLARHPKSN